MKRSFEDQKKIVMEQGIVPGVSVSWNLMGKPLFQRYGCVLGFEERCGNVMVRVVASNGTLSLMPAVLKVEPDVDDAVGEDARAVWGETAGA